MTKKNLVIPNKYGKLAKPPRDESEIIQLADELAKWSTQNTSLIWEDFPLSKGMSPYRFQLLADGNEYFAEALEYAKAVIGSRMQKGAFEKILPSDIVLKLLPLYNRGYRDWEMLRIMKDKENRTGFVNVIFESLEETSMRKQEESKVVGYLSGY